MFIIYFHNIKKFIDQPKLFIEEKNQNYNEIQQKLALLDIKVKSIKNGQNALGNKIDFIEENHGNKIKLVQEKSVLLEKTVLDLQIQTKEVIQS